MLFPADCKMLAIGKLSHFLIRITRSMHRLLKVAPAVNKGIAPWRCSLQHPTA